jgi:hypothetical protein
MPPVTWAEAKTTFWRRRSPWGWEHAADSKQFQVNYSARSALTPFILAPGHFLPGAN